MEAVFCCPPRGKVVSGFHGDNDVPADLRTPQACLLPGIHHSLLAPKNASKLANRLAVLSQMSSGGPWNSLPGSRTAFFSRSPPRSCVGIGVSSVCIYSLGITTRISFEYIAECTGRTMLSLTPSSPMGVHSLSSQDWLICINPCQVSSEVTNPHRS